MSDAPVLPYWQIFLDHSFGSFVGFWICAKVLMDFSRSEVIFATADFPLNQLFLRHPVLF